MLIYLRKFLVKHREFFKLVFLLLNFPPSSSSRVRIRFPYCYRQLFCFLTSGWDLLLSGSGFRSPTDFCKEIRKKMCFIRLRTRLNLDACNLNIYIETRVTKSTEAENKKLRVKVRVFPPSIFSLFTQRRRTVFKDLETAQRRWVRLSESTPRCDVFTSLETLLFLHLSILE